MVAILVSHFDVAWHMSYGVKQPAGMQKKQAAPLAWCSVDKSVTEYQALVP
jgi:hypothetical protein